MALILEIANIEIRVESKTGQCENQGHQDFVAHAVPSRLVPVAATAIPLFTKRNHLLREKANRCCCRVSYCQMFSP